MLWPVTDVRISQWAEVAGGGIALGRCCEAAHVLGAEQNPWRRPWSQQIMQHRARRTVLVLKLFLPVFPQ